MSCMVRNSLEWACSQSAKRHSAVACERLSPSGMFFSDFLIYSKLIGTLICEEKNMLENPEQNTETSWAVQHKYDSFAWKALGWFHSGSLHSCARTLLPRIIPLSLSENITSPRLLHSLAQQHNWDFKLQNGCRGIKNLFIFISVELISSPAIMTASPTLTPSWSVFRWGPGQMKIDVSAEPGPVHKQHL